MSYPNENDAWDAMDSYRPDLALEIWNKLISMEKDDQVRDDLRSNSCYALLGLNRIDDARKIYLELYNKYKNHRYAHQLCMVEREDKNYQKALEYLDLEKKLTPSDDTLSKAANLYEYGKIHQLSQKYEEALKYAEECIKFSLMCDDLIMLACANRLLGDIYTHSNLKEAQTYYLQAQKLFISAGDKAGADEVDELLLKLEN